MAVFLGNMQLDWHFMVLYISHSYWYQSYF